MIHDHSQCTVTIIGPNRFQRYQDGCVDINGQLRLDPDEAKDWVTALVGEGRNMTAPETWAES